MASDYNAYDLMVGTPVCTLDGDEIGKVKEVQGRYFKVDAQMQPDYWLRSDCVTSASGGRVTLGVDKDHLGDYKVDNPTDRR